MALGFPLLRTEGPSAQAEGFSISIENPQLFLSFPRRRESRLFHAQTEGLDAGLRRHDELSLHVKRGISTIPSETLKPSRL
jgi:hypothetical protein